ncbi:MAG: UDP-N-acetylmuramate dehydrogenase [Peptoniphilus sp.]|nr:UDP-N-acetylmuramate dehydrogenase [Peptoniphilus sp.]
MINFNKYGKFLEDEPLNKHTTFKIGGRAKGVLIPDDEQSLIGAIGDAKEQNIEYFIMGNGSNVLVDDAGYDGLVIILKSTLNRVEIRGAEVSAGAGISLRELANIALDNSLSGLEFAHGIPGSLGGGVIMNAGAYDGELKDVVKSVRILDENLDIRELTNEEMKFAYRNSVAQEKGYVVLSATFSLRRDKSKEEIREKMEDFWQRRSSKQPLEYPSAGSTFRRPKGYFAGKLIDDSGLRGARHGGAMVSEKHCGFVINSDNATSKDVKELIEMIQKIVYDKYKVNLVCEVKFIGG